MDTILGNVTVPFDLVNQFIDSSRQLLSIRGNHELTRLDLKDLSQKLTQLGKRIGFAKTWLRKLQHVDALQVGIAQEKIEDFEKCLDIQKAKVKSIEDRMKEGMERGYTSIFQQQLRDVVERCSELRENAEAVNGCIERLYSLLQDEQQPNLFIPIYSVPPNPARVLLNYSDCKTPEGRLKKDILRAAASNESLEKMTVVHGMGGIGKTCAVRGLVGELDVQERFTGGILFMSLGMDAALYTVIKELAKFMSKSGGNKESQKIKMMENSEFTEAVEQVAEWFRKYPCLFIIDDVWCRNGITFSTVHKLRNLAAQGHKDSRIVITTREQIIDYMQRPFRQREDVDSRNLLICTSDMKPSNEQYSSSMEHAVRQLLKMCDGHPISLAVVGSKVRDYVVKRDMTFSAAWCRVRDEFLSQTEQVVKAKILHNDERVEVNNILLTSVRTLDQDLHKKVETRRFASLSILQNRQEVTVRVLQRIWDVTSEDVIATVDLFEKFSIIHVTGSEEGRMEDVVSIHDLFMDVSAFLANEQGSDFLCNVSTTILKSYNSKSGSLIVHYESTMPQEHVLGKPPYQKEYTPTFMDKARKKMKLFHKNRPAEGPSEPTDSATMIISDPRKYTADKEYELVIDPSVWIEMKDDGFASQSLFRLLKISRVQQQGFKFLMEPRWIVKDTTELGRRKVSDDIQMTVDFLKQNQDYNRSEEKVTFLKMLDVCLREGEVSFFETNTMIWTQIHGRLEHFDYNRFVRDFLIRLRDDAPKYTYLCQSVFYVPRPSSRKVVKMNRHDYIFDVSYNGDVVETLFHRKPSYEEETFGCVYVNHFTEEDEEIRTEKLLNLQADWTINPDIDDMDYRSLKTHIAVSQSRDVVALNNDDSIIVYMRPGGGDPGQSGSEQLGQQLDGWERHTLQGEKFHFYHGYTIRLTANWLVLFNFRNSSPVYIWNYGDLTGWERYDTPTQMNYARDIAMGSNGKVIAAICNDLEVRVWHLNNDEWKPVFLNGEQAGQTSLSKIKISQDCRRLVALGDGEVTVWNWNGSSWVLGYPPPPNDVRDIHCVAISKDGSRFVANCEHGKMLMWGWDGSSWSLGSQLLNSTCDIEYMTISNENRRIVSCYSTGIVCINNWSNAFWNAKETPIGHSENVCVTKVSADLKTVVTGSSDGILVVWRWISDRWDAGEPLTAHTEEINSIAVNDDGSVIVSGSNDKTVMVWRLEGVRWLSDEPLGHTDPVISVFYCESRQRILSSVKDYSRLSVWDKVRGKWSYNSTFLRYPDIHSVAASGDGQRTVLSAYVDWTCMKLWVRFAEGETGEFDQEEVDNMSSAEPQPDFYSSIRDVEQSSALLAIINDGRRVALCRWDGGLGDDDDDLYLDVWDQLSDGSWQRSEIKHTVSNYLYPHTLEFSPDGSTLHANFNKPLEYFFWKLVKGTWELHNGNPSPHPTTTATASEHSRTMTYALKRMKSLSICPNWEDIFAVHRGFCVISSIKPHVGFLIEKH